MSDRLHDHGHPPEASASPGNSVETVTDPVCGMKVDPATSAHRAEHGGHVFHFCSAGCRAPPAG